MGICENTSFQYRVATCISRLVGYGAFASLEALDGSEDVLADRNSLSFCTIELATVTNLSPLSVSEHYV